MSSNKYRVELRRHGVCSLCGQRINDPKYSTVEHLIPRHRRLGADHHELAAAHAACNAWRDKASLIRAMFALTVSCARDPEAFRRWTHCQVAGRPRALGFSLDPPNLTSDELARVHGWCNRFRSADEQIFTIEVQS